MRIATLLLASLLLPATVQAEGGRPMDAVSFLRGRSLRPGMTLGDGA